MLINRAGEMIYNKKNVKYHREAIPQLCASATLHLCNPKKQNEPNLPCRVEVSTKTEKRTQFAILQNNDILIV